MNFGVVGCGYWGRKHLAIYHQLGVLHAACDSNPTTQQWVQEWNIPCYHSSQELYHHEALDGVSICTPHQHLTQEALIAVSHGVNVLVEKPMSLSSMDAWKLWAAAEATGTLVMPGLIEVFNPKTEAFHHQDCLHFTRLNRYCDGRDLLWDTIVHDVGLAFHLAPEWATFHVGWTSGWTKRVINGYNIICEGSLTRELEHFVECVRGNAEPKVTCLDGVRVVEVVEQIHQLSAMPN